MLTGFGVMLLAAAGVGSLGLWRSVPGEFAQLWTMMPVMLSRRQQALIEGSITTTMLCCLGAIMLWAGIREFRACRSREVDRGKS